MTTQTNAQQRRKDSSYKHLLLRVLVLAGLILITIIWILNIIGIVNGPWGAILGAILTALGVGLTLLYSQKPPAKE